MGECGRVDPIAGASGGVVSGAATLRDLLELKHVSAPAPDSETGYEEEPTTYAIIPAEVVPADARGVERTVGVQVQAGVSHLARIYYRDDVKVTDVGTWTTRRGATHMVRVTGVRPDPQERWTWIALQEQL
jgi:hypothetical protein